MDNEHSGSKNSGSGAVTSAPADIAEEKTGFGAQAGAALSKVGEAAQQVGSHVKEAATSLATKTGEKAKGLIDQQVASGADFLGYIGSSARVAADTLHPDAPHLAGLVRGWRAALPTSPTRCGGSRRRRCWRPHPTMCVRIPRWCSAPLRLVVSRWLAYSREACGVAVGPTHGRETPGR